jgi:hypothetical protein
MPTIERAILSTCLSSCATTERYQWTEASTASKYVGQSGTRGLNKQAVQEWFNVRGAA